jgi:hypothetical protein
MVSVIILGIASVSSYNIYTDCHVHQPVEVLNPIDSWVSTPSPLGWAKAQRDFWVLPLPDLKVGAIVTEKSTKSFTYRME